jgi:hypothetical protein
MTQRLNLLTLTALAVLLTPALARADDKDSQQKGTFVEVPGLAASVMPSYGRHGVLTVEAGLDVPDPTLRNYVNQVLPRLQDAYAQTLQGYAGGLRPGALPDADYIGRRLQAATDQVLGRPGARLLLGGIMAN